jgi:Raf kinase inhibitor-like YbhB/YbcL family protein
MDLNRNSVKFMGMLAVLGFLFITSAPTSAGFQASGNLIRQQLMVGEGARAMAFVISSTSFQNDGTIPKKFTCDGDDVSPEVSWANPPAGTKSFALIADDPDAPAGTWTHWVIFDLPSQTASLPEGVKKVEEVPGGGSQGRNDFRKVGYGGPCPPPGKPHRYVFKIYALDRMLKLNSGSSKQEVERAIENHILGSAELMARYQR